MTISFSRKLAIVIGIITPVAETVRRWNQLGQLSVWPICSTISLWEPSSCTERGEHAKTFARAGLFLLPPGRLRAAWRTRVWYLRYKI